LDEIFEIVMRLARNHADIGKDHDRYMLVEKRLHRVGDGWPGLSNIGERGNGLYEIIGRCEKRLGDIRRLPADKADAAAARTLVKQVYRACRTSARNFEPENLVAQFDRHLEFGLRFGCAAKIKRPFAQLKPFAIERADNADLWSEGSWTNNTDIETARLIFHAGKRPDIGLIRNKSGIGRNRSKRF